MDDHLLTFELELGRVAGEEQLHIHLDPKGRELLIRLLQRLHLPHDHEHLFTEVWGGWELSPSVVGDSEILLNKVTLHFWDSATPGK